MGASANLTVGVAATLDAVIDIGDVIHNVNYNANVPMGNGTGLNQINQVYVDKNTLAASATVDVDLAGGLVNALGQTLTLTRVKAIIVKADPANTNDVVIGGAPANAFIGPFGAATHTINVKPGGVVALIAPDAAAYPVVAGTGDLLRFTNGGAGTSVNYDLMILGTA